MRLRSLLDTALACLHAIGLCYLIAALVFVARDFAAQQVRQKEVVAMETLHEANRRTYYQRFPGKYLVDPKGNAWFVPPPIPPWERTKSSVAFIYRSTGTTPRPLPAPSPGVPHLKMPKAWEEERRLDDLIDRARRS